VSFTWDLRGLPLIASLNLSDEVEDLPLPGREFPLVGRSIVESGCSAHKRIFGGIKRQSLPDGQYHEESCAFRLHASRTYALVCAMNTDTYLPQTTDATPWESALYAFLAEKHLRTGSIRTVQSYSRILRYFFAAWRRRRTK
jgi:hypothetical protein